MSRRPTVARDARTPGGPPRGKSGASGCELCRRLENPPVLGRVSALAGLPRPLQRPRLVSEHGAAGRKLPDRRPQPPSEAWGNRLGTTQVSVFAPSWAGCGPPGGTRGPLTQPLGSGLAPLCAARRQQGRRRGSWGSRVPARHPGSPQTPGRLPGQQLPRAPCTWSHPAPRRSSLGLRKGQRRCSGPWGRRRGGLGTAKVAGPRMSSWREGRRVVLGSSQLRLQWTGTQGTWSRWNRGPRRRPHTGGDARLCRTVPTGHPVPVQDRGTVSNLSSQLASRKQWPWHLCSRARAGRPPPPLPRVPISGEHAAPAPTADVVCE